MGGWDIFCAICGGPFLGCEAEEENFDEHSEDVQQSLRILRHEDTAWVKKFRCIGEDFDSESIDKVFISGPAQYSDYGGCNLEPPDEIASEADELEDFISVYSWGGRDDQPLVFPYHDICLHTILDRVISHMSGSSNNSSESIDKEVVYRALKGFGTCSSDNYMAYLDRLDYGEQMNLLHGQYWYTSPGAESYMVNPATIPALQEYYSKLPLLQPSQINYSASVKGTARATRDVFSELPSEILQHITRFMSIESVNTLREVNPSVAAFANTNSFWRERVLQDQPWLYDFPDKKNMALDWARIYKDLRLQSEKNTESSILGLANRRRIWGLCEQIAESYMALKQEKDSQKDSALLDDAVADKMIKVGQLEGAKFEMSKLALFDDFEDVGKHESTLQVHWSGEGYLLGFSVKTADSTHHHLGASNRIAARTNSVSIQKGDWLRGFVFISNEGIEYTYLCENDIGRVVVGVELIFEHGDSILLGQSNGDRRIAQVAEEELLVGLLVEWTHTGGIVRLSLLKIEMLSSSDDSSENANIRTKKSLGTVLWRNNLPPAHLNITKPLIGYWSSDFSVELNPHDAVVFGQDEAELARLTTISIDAQFGGFELGYADGATKAYGPQQWGMKTFHIDGPGGERVTAVFIDVSTHPNGLRLLTNRKRQLTVGPHLAPGRHIIRSSATKAICGLFCAWSPGDGYGQARMDSLGTLKFSGSFETATTNDDDDEGYAGPRDEAGLWWEPEAPPPSWRADGPVYGQHEQKTRWGTTTDVKPAEYDVACWFDLTRRVDHVRVTFTHGDKKHVENGMSLVSITMEYTDGSRASAGPEGFAGYTKACSNHKNSPNEEGKKEWPFCWCHYGFSDKQELAQAPHYRHEEFAVGGESIQAIRLWTAPWLQGFQFVSARGEGPTWGVCEGEPATIIRFAQDGDEADAAVGLKVGMAGNERPTTYLDRIVVSLQALVKTTPQ